MIKLAALALKGPLVAASVSTGLLLGGLILPFILGPLGAFASLGLVWCSAAVLALVLLRQGVNSAMLSLGVAMLLVGVLSVVSGGGFFEMLLLTLQFWLPALLLAFVLRQSVSLDLTLAAGAGIGIVSVLLMHVLMGDPQQGWQELFEGHIQQALERLDSMDSASGSSLEGLEQGSVASQGELQLRQQLAALRASVPVMARLATPTMGIMMMLTGIGSILLARAWQAKLFNPGGFQQEFHQLKFGKAMSLIVLVTATLAMLLRVPLLNHIALVMLACTLFQGLAVVHSLIKSRGMSGGWLVGVYTLLLLPHTSALLGALGLADNWLNFRRKKGPPDEPSASV